VAVDFTDSWSVAAALSNLRSAKKTKPLLFCDSPRNWWLDCVDIGAVAKIAHEHDGKLAVDVSVQPLQRPLHLGADVAVCSLSKYPSMGLTLGGAIFANSFEIHDRITNSLAREGSILSPDAATTIWTQAVSLRDRLGALSTKILMLSKFLGNRSAVRQVRVVNAEMAGGLVGGQLTFHVVKPAMGFAAEKIVGHNSLRTRSGLHLACTFGGVMTTFEHFASNIRYRTGLPRESSNEVELPSDIIRVGVGCEQVDDILADLDFVLTGASLHV
jgi:cystathionine beta-lyase/cystathionine gamma-synthase